MERTTRAVLPGECLWANSMGCDGHPGTTVQYLPIPCERLFRVLADVLPARCAAKIHTAATAGVGFFHAARRNQSREVVNSARLVPYAELPRETEPCDVVWGVTEKRPISELISTATPGQFCHRAPKRCAQSMPLRARVEFERVASGDAQGRVVATF